MLLLLVLLLLRTWASSLLPSWFNGEKRLAQPCLRRSAAKLPREPLQLRGNGAGGPSWGTVHRSLAARQGSAS